MKVDFLIATMNRTDISFIFQMFIQYKITDINAIIINQCTVIDPPSLIDTPHEGIRVISVNDKGLAKSRNLALANSIGDICVIADDDFIYSGDALNTIIQEYKNNPKADIITFQTNSLQSGQLRKNYPTSRFKHNRKSLSRVSSSDITFLRRSIKRAGITFDEKFGLGAKYLTGEDNIFLSDCIQNGLDAYFCPRIILKTEENTTGFKMLEKPDIRGIVFRRLFPEFIFFVTACFYTSISKRSYYQSKIPFISYFFRMVKAGMLYSKETIKSQRSH